ncbi:hypothetical protein QE152_g36183 [Popillia japonica]|uniref:Uncharacterized protein n=1 Tax=Popillia japonica TaxID=7064 RepID=A0AAW1IE21_POPJA
MEAEHYKEFGREERDKTDNTDKKEYEGNNTDKKEYEGNKGEHTIQEQSTSENPFQRRDKKRVQEKEGTRKSARTFFESAAGGLKTRNEEGMKEVNSLLAKVIKRTKELKKLVNESSKTKVEIKQVARELDYLVARELDYLVDNLQKGINRYETHHDCKEATRGLEMKDEGIQAVMPGVSVCVQAEKIDIELEKQRLELETRNSIRLALESRSGFAGLTGLLDKTWPKDMYTSTKMMSPTAADPKVEGDMALLIDPDRVMEDTFIESLIKPHSDVREMEGDMALLIDPDRVMEDTFIESLIKPHSDVREMAYRNGVNSIEDVFNMVCQLKENMSVHPSDHINLVLGQGLNEIYIRKACEYVFYGTDTKITLIVPKDTQIPTTKEVVRPVKGRVLVKCGKSTYADLLKTVKEKVDLNRVGVNVKTIKKTARGDLMLEVDGDVRKADVLKEAISKKINNDVKVANNMTTIHILDIDITTTKEEVERVINSHHDKGRGGKSHQ